MNAILGMAEIPLNDELREYVRTFQRRLKCWPCAHTPKGSSSTLRCSQTCQPMERVTRPDHGRCRLERAALQHDDARIRAETER